MPSHPVGRFFVSVFAGPGHRVDRVLGEGDEVAGFRVLDTPGHSAGHVAFWRESDRVLILGDVLNNMDVITGDPRPARAEALPDPRSRPEPRARRGASASSSPSSCSSATARRCATPRKFVDFVAALPS